MSTVRPVVIPITGDVSGLDRSVRSIDGTLTRATGTADRFGKALVGAFAVDRAVRFGAAIVGVAGQYHQALADVEAITGASVREMETLDKVSRSAGLSWGTGATQFAQATGELARGNVAIEEINDRAGKAAATLSIAGNIAIPAAAESLAKLGNVFKLTGAEYVDAVDYSANFANKTTGSVESLMMGMSSFAGAGRNAFRGIKKDLLETVTALALVEQSSGQTGQDAGTTARTALNRLSQEIVQKRLEKWNLDFFDKEGDLLSLTGLAKEAHKELDDLDGKRRTQAIMEVGGADGFRFWQALLAKTPKQIDELRVALGKQGSAEEVAEKRNQGYARSLERLKAAREEAFIVMGQGAAGQMGEAADLAVSGLQDPKVQQSLERVGDLLSGTVAGGIRLVRDGLEDGTIPETLEQIVDVAGSAGETFGDFVEVGGELLSLVNQLPDGVLATAAAFALWRRASLGVAGTLASVRAQGAGVLATARGGAPVVSGSATGAGGAPIVGAAGNRGPIIVGGAPGGIGGVGRQFGPQVAPTAAQAQQARARAIGQQVQADRAMREAQARLAAYRATQVDQTRRNNPIPASVMGPVGDARAAQREAARQRQIAERDLDRARTEMRRAEEQARREARSAARRSAVKSGAGGAAVGGAIAAAASDDFLGAITMGAAAGSIGGPWGMAGGAVAAAAGVGIKKLLQSGAKKEAEELGRQIATGTGRYLADESVKTLTDARKKMEDERPREVPIQAAGMSPQMMQAAREAHARRLENDKEFTAAAGKYGGAAGDAYVGDRLKKMNATFITAAGTAKEFEKLKGLDSRAAREAAAAPIAAYLDSQAKENPKLKGAGQRFLKLINAQVPKNQKISASVAVELDIQATAKGARNSLEKALGRQEGKFQGLTKINPKDMGYDQLVWHANKRMTELRKIMREKSGSAEAARAAEELARLRRAVGRYADDAAPAWKRAGEAAVAHLDELNRKAKTTADTIGGISPAIDSLGDTLADVLPDVAAPPKKPKPHRAGGRVQSFRAGGEVIAVSSGEGMRYPDGSWAMVPGSRTNSDNVLTWAPYDTEIYTGHGLALLGAGYSRAEALSEQAPHFGADSIPGFATGGKVRGKTSWFGGPNDASTRGRKTALGLSPNEPGVAIRPGATFQSGRPYLGGYWDVHVGGRHSVLRQIDLGPHERTGKRIDITSAALGRFGYNEKTFPTGSTGWAAWLGKDRATALRRAGAASGGDAIASDIMVGRSLRNIAGIVESAGFERGRQYDPGQVRRFGTGPAKAIAEALGQVQTTRRIEQESSGLGTGKNGAGSTRVARMNQWFGAAAKKHPNYVYGGGHSKIGAGPFDCSGYVYGGLHAGGFANTPGTTDQLKTFGDSGPGKWITIGVRGSTGRGAHTMIKVGNRYWEAGKGGVGARSGWSGSFGIKRHPKGFRSGGLVGAPPAVRRAVDLPGAFVPGSPNWVGEGYAAGGVVGGLSESELLARLPKNGEPAAVDNGIIDVRRRAPDVPPTSTRGDYKLLTIMQSGGDLQGRVEEMLRYLEGVGYAKLEAIRRGVQQAANSGGTKRDRARAQAALSAIDDTMDAKLGGALRRSDQSQRGYTQAMDVIADIQAINRTAGTEAGLRQQIAQTQRFLAEAPGNRKALEQAVARAQRAVDQRPGDQAAVANLAAAKEELRELNTDVSKARVAVVGFEDQIVEVTKAAREEAVARLETAAQTRGTLATLTAALGDDVAAKRDEAAAARQRAAFALSSGDSAGSEASEAAARLLDREAERLLDDNGRAEIELRIARAARTAGNDDDIAAQEELRALEDRRRQRASARGDIEVETSAEQTLKSIDDNIKGLRQETAQTTEQQLAVSKQQLSESQATNRVLTAQGASNLQRILESNRRQNTSWPGRTPHGWGS